MALLKAIFWVCHHGGIPGNREATRVRDPALQLSSEMGSWDNKPFSWCPWTLRLHFCPATNFFLPGKGYTFAVKTTKPHGNWLLFYYTAEQVGSKVSCDLHTSPCLRAPLSRERHPETRWPSAAAESSRMPPEFKAKLQEALPASAQVLLTEGQSKGLPQCKQPEGGGCFAPPTPLFFFENSVLFPASAPL